MTDPKAEKRAYARQQAETSGAARDEACRRVYRETRDPRQAIKAWCGGNRWAQENARAVGNWPTKR